MHRRREITPKTKRPRWGRLGRLDGEKCQLKSHTTDDMLRGFHERELLTIDKQKEKKQNDKKFLE